MEENNQKVCPKDCMKCNVQQRIYCASQMSRNSLEMLEYVIKRQDEIVERIDKIERCNSETNEGLFNPLSDCSNEESEEEFDEVVTDEA